MCAKILGPFSCSLITVLVMNPGGRKSGTGTQFSVIELIDKKIDELLELAEEDRSFGKRKQETLKALVRDTSMWHSYRYTYCCIEQSFKRDGRTCLLTHT